MRIDRVFIAKALVAGFAAAACLAAATAQQPVSEVPANIVDVPAAALQRLTGYYQLQGRQRVWVRMQGSHLVARVDGSTWTRLLALSPQRFALQGSALEIEFDARPGQRANVAALRKGGHPVALLVRAADPTPLFASVPFYLRGSMNDWAAIETMQPIDMEHYVVTIVLPAGRHEFKLGSQDWDTIDFGGADTSKPVVPGRRELLAQRGGNMVLQVERAGRYQFALDALNVAAPAITVTALP